MVIDNNGFVEKLLPGFTNRSLGDAEMAVYRAPYAQAASRKPTLVWPLEIPIGGQPADTTETLKAIETFMAATDLPILLLYASPGAVVPPSAVPWYENRIRNLETVYVGPGLHFIQEDQPEAIGRALREWLRRHHG
jgi:haloalkane dehalogenase